MQVLSNEEINMVSGGTDVAFVAEMMELIHEAGAFGFFVGAAFFAGVGIGMALNAGFEYLVGQTFGGWLYDVFN